VIEGETDDPPKAESATQERLAKAGDNVEDFITDTGRRTLRLLDDSVMDMLFSRGSITGDMYAAGQRYERDWYESGLATSGTVDLSNERVDGGQHVLEPGRRLDALTRWKSANISVGDVHRRALVCLVLLGEDLEHYGRRTSNRISRKDAVIAAITAMQLALQQLDQSYYGKRETRTTSAHSADYRPGLPPIDNSRPRE